MEFTNQQNKPKNATTTAKANEQNTTANNMINMMSGISSMQSGKTGAERAQGIAQLVTGIMALL